MRTFAQKQNRPQKPVSSSLARPNKATLGPAHREHSILHLQSTIGNQAVLRLLQTNAEELKTGLTNTTSSRFGHDFSRIPIHPPAAGVIQTKLAIDKPGDEYEQEADRISEQVMRTPEPQVQRACPCGGGCPKCQTEQPDQEHESLQTKRVQGSETGQIAAPPIVHEVLRSPGQPLDPATRAFMEPRFGYDFTGVRVHTDAKAAESARAVNALAYTVGPSVVFGANQYSPHTQAGRSLVAHELMHTIQQGVGGPFQGRMPVVQGRACEQSGAPPEAASRVVAGLPIEPTHVLALQTSVGNRAVSRILSSRYEPAIDLATRRPGGPDRSLQRRFTSDGRGGWLMQFTVGTEISSELAAEAFDLTRKGPLDDGDLAELRKLALASDRSIDDNERMFLAALLDGRNAAAMHSSHASGGFGTGASVTFPGDTITAANRDRVRDFDRDPEQKTSMELGAKPARFDKLIVGLADRQFSAAAQQLVKLAASDKVPYERVYEAMLAAASDSTPGDRVFAGAAYVIAKRAKLQVADDLLSGAIKIDEVPPADIRGTAEYVTMSTLVRKGDTIYLPTNFDIASLAHQGLLVHELTHAGRDKAATGPGFIAVDVFELEGYRAQGRYWLNQMQALRGSALTAAIAALAQDANELSILAMLVETRGDPPVSDIARSPFVLIGQINRASTNGLAPQDWNNAIGLNDTDLKNEALSRISQAPVYKGRRASVGGLRGESFLDE